MRATLAHRLGIEQAAQALIDLGERPGAHRPGPELLTLVPSMLAGGACIDDADLLRCGATSRLTTLAACPSWHDRTGQEVRWRGRPPAAPRPVRRARPPWS